MELLYVKSLHIIFVVTWFAGLFYIVRLFIYHVEAEDEEQGAKAILQKQYKLMSKRLWYGITWPSAVLTAVFGTWLLLLNPGYLLAPWMHLKLTFIVALYVYHFLCHRMFDQLQNDKVKYSSFKLRIWNEVATVILFAVVFLVVLKDNISWVWGIAGLVVFSLLLMFGIKVYKNFRDKNDQSASDDVIKKLEKKEPKEDA